MKRIAYSGFGLVLSLGLLAVPAGAQTQTQSTSASQAPQGSSLGDYARQIRKDTQPKAKPKVFDNDNLPTEDKLSVVGTAPAAGAVAQNSDAPKPADSSADAAKASAAGDSKAALPPTPKPSDDAATRQTAYKQWQQQISAQKDQIDLLKREVDVLQREYQVRAAAFYADAGNRLRNSEGWDKQDAQYKEQIAAKQKSLEDATQKLEETEEKARRAGVPANMRDTQ